jgi:hypothetical protein
MSYRKPLLTIILLLISTPSMAINWHKPTNVIETKTASSYLEFGDVKVTMDVTYSTSPLIKPEYVLSMLKGEDLLAKIPGVGIQVAQGSIDNSVIVGLSNSSVPGTAFIILNKKGELLREVKHISVAFDYCFENREMKKAIWFDPKKPNIQFEYARDGETVTDVTIQNCKGEQVSLPEVVLKAYDNIVKEVEKKKQQQ